MNIKTFTNNMLIDHWRWLAGGVTLVLLLLGYLLVISPKWSEIQAAAVDKRSSTEADLASQTQYAQALADSVEKYKKALPETDLEKINSFLPSDADFPGLMLTINNIITSAGLKLDNITVDQSGQVVAATPTGTGGTTNTNSSSGAAAANAATISGVNLKTQDVTITVSGGTTYESFKNLLKMIESSQRLLDVVSVNFTPTKVTDDAKSSSGTSWSFMLRTYYLPNNPK